MAIDDLIGITKIISVLATGLFGVVAWIKENNNKSGTVTKWGKIALIGVFLSAGLALALQVLESSKAKDDAKEAQMRSDTTTGLLHESLHAQDSILKHTLVVSDSVDSVLTNMKVQSSKTEHLLDMERIAHREIVRAYYPLEPITLYYDKEYPMDQECFKEYAARLQAAIIAKSNGDLTPDDLSKGNVSYDLDRDLSLWPTTEESAAWTLFHEDKTTFSFSLNNAKKESTITFMVLPEENTRWFMKLKSKGIISTHVSIEANYVDRVFLQRVECKNPLRTGSDFLAMSAFDLIGREVSWDKNSPPDCDLIRVAFNFEYDYSYERFIRYRNVKNKKTFIVSAEDVGLEDYQ